MMLKLLSTSINLPSLNIVLLLARITVGALMLSHGIPKLMKFFATGDITFSDPLGVGTIPSLILAIFAEVFCSILVIIGLGTRIAVIPTMITMLVVIFLVHMHDPFGKKELPMLYLTIYTFLLICGSGKYSVDSLLLKKQRNENLAAQNI